MPKSPARGQVLLTAALLASLALAGCTSPEGGQASPTPSADSDSAPDTFDHPSQFDWGTATHLKAADGAPASLLSGYFEFVFGDNGQVQALDVRTGQRLWSAPLAATPGTWRCPTLAVDDNNLYAIAGDFSDQSGPVPVTLTAYAKDTGDVAWRFSPTTTKAPVSTECGNVLNYDVTPTSHGLLVMVSEAANDDGTAYTSYSDMLDATAGTLTWNSTSAVQAASGADSGIAVAATVAANGSQHTTVSTIDLGTGQLGDSVDDVTTPSGSWPPTYSLLGVAGGAQQIVKQVTKEASSGSLTTTTSLITEPAAGDATTTSSTLTLAGSDFDLCQLATSNTLVCTKISQPGVAYGVNLADGAVSWHHTYSTDPEPAPPLLFNGYLYGTTNGGTFALDADTGDVPHVSAAHQVTNVNGAGVTFDVTSGNATQCWWAPAVG